MYICSTYVYIYIYVSLLYTCVYYMFLLMTIFVHGMQDGNHIGSWRKHVFLQDVHHRLYESVEHFSILELDIVDIWGENMLKYERHCIVFIYLLLVVSNSFSCFHALGICIPTHSLIFFR